MDFSLNDEQRAWQLKARKFAEEELRPISLQRDRIADPRETFDWDVIEGAEWDCGATHLLIDSARQRLV